MVGNIKLASKPNFPFRILSRNFSDKIQNGKPGFEANINHYAHGWTEHVFDIEHNDITTMIGEI